MKLAATVCAVAAVVCTLTACGSGEESEQPRSAAATSVNAVLEGAKSAAFVASFKAAFPELARGRSDRDITSILDETCVDLQESRDQQDVQEDIKSRAENDETQPTDNQARQIYEMAEVACP